MYAYYSNISTLKKWSNTYIWDRAFKVKPYYQLFGNVHDSCGLNGYNHIVVSDGGVLDDQYRFNDINIALEKCNHLDI